MTERRAWHADSPEDVRLAVEAYRGASIAELHRLVALAKENLEAIECTMPDPLDYERSHISSSIDWDKLHESAEELAAIIDSILG